MNAKCLTGVILLCMLFPAQAGAGQAPGLASDPDIPITGRDRVYAAEQFSNTVSVTDPVNNKLLGVIRLGEPQPANLSPLYRGQILVHGLGFSPDRKTLAVVSIGSNSVSFINTSTNSVKHVTYVGRAPHEAFFTPDGKQVWVTIRGEDYIAVLDAKTYEEIARISVPTGPGMQIFSPDGVYGYVCSSFTPETVIITVLDRKIVGRVTQASPFCPNIAASPDGRQVWFTLKDVGMVQVFDAQPPFTLLKTIETGPITNHVNFVRNDNGIFAYVTVGGMNLVKVFTTDDFKQVSAIKVGKMPHGIWPSGDGKRVYIGLENEDALSVVDTSSNQVIAKVPIGQAPQALVYVPNAVSSSDEGSGLQPLGTAGHAARFTLAPPDLRDKVAPTSVTLFDQGLTQVLQAAVTGLAPKQSFVLALVERPDGSGERQALGTFTTNPAGAAIVNAVGPIRQIVEGSVRADQRYLAIFAAIEFEHGKPAQTQRR